MRDPSPIESARQFLQRFMAPDPHQLRYTRMWEGLPAQTPEQIGAAPDPAERARRVAADNNITIIWQDPCFEAVLLRHLEGHATRRPPDTPEAGRALVRAWPEYQKPMPRAGLARRIDRASVLRAAAVEPELEALLRCLGLI